MEAFELHGEISCVYYVSEKCRTWRPAKTLLVFAPERVANSVSRLRDFAATSGWLEAAEKDGAVLVLPVAPSGWGRVSTDRIKGLYRAVWKDTASPDVHESLRPVWCWETLIFAVGYDEGAVFAGNLAVDHPNAFAHVAMVNGVPDCYDGGQRDSDRWLLPDASPESRVKNCEIPVAVWFLGEEDTQTAEDYFKRSASADDQVKISRGTFGPDPETTRKIMAEFCTRIRWKNSPDGTPARLMTETELVSTGGYRRCTAESNGIQYNYYVRLPKGVTSAEGLPVVTCMHGHGEPAWMFAQKNGWPELQDETGEFVFVSPDSPENTWLIERDEGMHQVMIDQLAREYGIDRTRVYLTGFSNGALATCWYGERHPELYAAIAPWNSPVCCFEDRLLRDGWEMPMFAINGDLDHKMDVPRRSYPKLFEAFITLNGGRARPAEIPKPWPWKYDDKWDAGNRYTAQAGYRQGERLTTYVYHNLDGHSRFCYTSVKDMPHGAIADEARATWAFLRRFSRPVGSKQVVDHQPEGLESCLDRITLPSGTELLVYVPTSANSYTPARSIMLFPEAKNARDAAVAEKWLVESRWVRQANRDGSVLLIPVSGGDWGKLPLELVVEMYQATWGKTRSREPGNIAWRLAPGGGKQGNVWMWEVLWNIVGYGDGAAFAGACGAAHPNRFASVTLIGGAPTVFPDGDLVSDHFLVSKAGKNPDRMLGVSPDYDVRVVDIPSAVWMMGENTAAMENAATYFRQADKIPDDARTDWDICPALDSYIWSNPEEPAQRVVVSTGGYRPIPQELMDWWIGPSVRWKNGPDGTLKRFFWKDQVEAGQSPYEKRCFRCPFEVRDRTYYVYRPKTMGPKAPVVITIHGHGEPAWMFLSKNGWPQLADQEGILIVSPQDISENRWYGEEDNESFRYLVEDLLERYDVDPERIYISGFSNGNMQCYGAAAAHPELFAGMWPMSRAAGAPMFPLEEGEIPDLERLRRHGLEMPMFGVTGDNDGWIVEHPEREDSSLSETVKTFLELAGTSPRKAEIPAPLYWQPDEYRDGAWYRDHYHFREADRFQTWVYHNQDGEPRVCITVMKNMPHGTIWEETVAAWDFLRHFLRKSDGRIQYI